MMPDVARKILSKDSAADIERTKEMTEVEMTSSGGVSKHQGFEVNGMCASTPCIYGCLWKWRYQKIKQLIVGCHPNAKKISRLWVEQS